MVRAISVTSFLLVLVMASLATVEPAAGQQTVAFGQRPTRELILPQFTDDDVTQLVETLDQVLPGSLPPADWGEAARAPLWDFVRRLQDGLLTTEQEDKVLGHLRKIELAHPQNARVVSEVRRAVSTLTVGKQAPEIVGANLDGEPMKLSDYRGKVVVLKFGGAWCGICRAEYPYERFLMELYTGWPFAILGVDSSDSSDAARQGRFMYGLSYPAWWDGASGHDGAGRGPIATEWNVQGWPTTYVLDADGRIRFVDLRNEDLMKAVRQLLVEEQRRLLKAGASR
jgi:peroxiredoxin